MFIPYKTDAPVYHWPYGTVFLMAVNVVVLLAEFAGSIDVSAGMLQYGGELHPAQWVTSNFLHLGPIHLIGNMFFLWPFGVLVEGKVGWWKFLLIYLGIGAVQSASEQMIMLSMTTSVPGSMGASAIIFGLMGIAWVWAPRNDVTCVLLLLFRSVEFDISILMFGAFMVAKELFFVIFGITGGAELLHLSGALIGVGVGLGMLKLGLVDCEGYDVGAVFRGTEGMLEELPLDEERGPSMAETSPFQKTAVRAQFRQYVQRGHPEAAMKLRQKLQQQGQPLELDRKELAALITALHKKRLWRDSAPLMADYLSRFSERADDVRLKLAQICLLELERPLRALELLQEVDANGLSADRRKLWKKLVIHAKRMHADGTFELDDESW